MNAKVLILFFCFIPCVLIAQEEEKTKHFRVIFLAKIKPEPKKLFLFDGTKSRMLVPTTVNMSQVVALSPEAEFIEVVSSDTVVSEPTLGAPKVKVPESISYFYLLVDADPENEVCPVKLEIVDASQERIVPGETLWMNFTKKIIQGELGDQKIIIEPDSQKVMKSPRADSGYYKASFSYKIDKQGDFFPIMKKSWWLDIDSTHLGIIVDRGGRIPTIYMLRDRKEPTSTEP